MKQLVSRIIFLLLASLSTGVLQAAAAPPMAKDGCDSKCGNITIPFPFGMGNGCFLDEWYEIVCQSHTSARLKKKIDLEVLSITLPNLDDDTNGMMSIRAPIVHSNTSCGNDTYKRGVPINLEGSHFVFSQESNTFISVGCNVVTFLNSSGSSVVGCKSRCHGDIPTGNDSCSGRDGCCLTSIRGNLQSLIVDFKDEDMAVKECKYAILVNSSWLNASMNSTRLPILGMSFDTATAVLEWGIAGNSTYVSDAQNPRLPRSHPRCDSYSLSGVYRYLNPMPFAQCQCRYGFSGNPYLPGGCQDIDECEDPYYYCPGMSCVNNFGSYKCVDGGRTTKIALIGIGAGLGGLSLLLLSWWLYKVIRRRREIKLKKKYFKRNGGLLLQQQLSSPQGNIEKNKLFNSEDLDKATDHFNENRVLGQGGQGTVYKGMLVDGRIVAIKKSKEIDEGKVEQFINEVMILSQVSHRNVVKLLGCCLETQVPLLVYEFIPNGNLYEYLHDPNQESLISWSTRLRIATEIAGALFYLHSVASIPIYHRDIKSTNILLDEKYRAKIADFGTSKSVSLDQTHVTTLVQGTFGYLDPEYFQSSQFTDKSDVYSFGVVLIELITRQKPISSLRAQEGRSLATYFIISMEEKCLFDIVDPHVLKEGKREEVMAVANLTKRCLNLHGRNRPTMKEVALELQMIMEPQNPVSFQQINQQEASEANGFRDVGFTNDRANIGIFSDVQPLISGAS